MERRKVLQGAGAIAAVAATGGLTMAHAAVTADEGHKRGMAQKLTVLNLRRNGAYELAVKTDKPGNCYLETRAASMNGRRLFFAGAKIKKNYVSFYLTPLYMFPDLSDRISPTLRKLRQGQSCFNFTTVNQDCFDELNSLTQSAFQKLKAEALL